MQRLPDRTARSALGASSSNVPVMTSPFRIALRRSRPAIEAFWGTGCVIGAAALLTGKAALLSTGIAALANTGVLANLALLGGGLMFLREARRHARAARVMTTDAGS
jgi:hypothetical protein